MKLKFLFFIIISLTFQVITAQNIALQTDTTLIAIQEIDEVQVHGVKHSSSIINEPISVTGISSRELNNREITSVKELSSRIPNFFMPDYGSKLTTPVYMRGIGSRINSPAVALYVDNVPHFEKSLFEFELVDIERIEVLRGPQGTLYGRNTMGGIINIFTQRPSQIRETRISVNGGNYNSFRTQISHNQPISENLQINFAGSFNMADGYYLNEFSNAKVDDAKNYAGRIKVTQKFNANLTSDFIVSYDKSNQGGYPYAVYNDSEQTTSAVNYDSYSYYDREMLSTSALIKYNGASFNINSVSSYQYFDDLQNVDQDFTSRSIAVAIQNQNQHMFSQEIVVKSNNPNSKIDWLVGAFGFAQQLDKFVDVTFGADGIAQFGYPGPTSQNIGFNQQIVGAALFQQTTINDIFINGLSLALGVRVDAEEASLDYFVDRIVMGNATRTNEFDSKLKFLNILPKATLTYKFSPQNFIYSSIATGYNSGGFNTVFEDDKYKTFEPEESWNYEIGSKNKWLGNHLTSRVSIFYIDWTNQQISQPPPSSQGLMLTNAGKSISRGAEIELIGHITANLTTQASYGYTDAFFTQYIKSETVNYNGNKIPYIPEHTFDIGSTYTIPLKGSFPKRITVDVNYREIGKHFWNEDNNAYQDSYGLLNAKAKFAFNHFSVSVWGKNILNTEYNSFYFKALGNSYVQIAKPALFGLSVDVRF